jgi:BON domain
MRQHEGHSTTALIGALGLGAATGFGLAKLDRRRRHEAVDRSRAAVRHAAVTTRRRADYEAGKVKGAAHAVTAPLRPARTYDDATLADKVRSELFRPHDAPKGHVSINVAKGIVELRGQLQDADQIERLVQEARRIEGVADVRNLLHRPA